MNISEYLKPAGTVAFIVVLGIGYYWFENRHRPEPKETPTPVPVTEPDPREPEPATPVPLASATGIWPGVVFAAVLVVLEVSTAAFFLLFGATESGSGTALAGASFFTVFSAGRTGGCGVVAGLNSPAPPPGSSVTPTV